MKFVTEELAKLSRSVYRFEFLVISLVSVTVCLVYGFFFEIWNSLKPVKPRKTEDTSCYMLVLECMLEAKRSVVLRKE